MNYNFMYFISKIQTNNEIGDKEKKELVMYFYKDFYYKVFASTEQDYQRVEAILNDLNYDLEKFKKYINFAYMIRNAINDKSGSTRVKPNTSYILELYNTTKKLNFNYLEYSLGHKLCNVTLTRTMFRLIANNDILNDEISILDFAKNMCDKYYLDKERNEALYYVLKAIDMVERGINELDVKGEKIFLSDEIESLFSMKHLPHELALTDIIKEFYPIFGNEVFNLIKECSLNSNDNEFNTTSLMKYLRNCQDRLSFISKSKERIKASVKKIELDSEKSISQLFADLFITIEDNKYIDSSLKNKLLDNINSIYEKYRLNQDQFLDEELDLFFKNCTSYINDLIIPNKDRKNKIDELIISFLEESKDFFLEYDAKKFKEILEFIMNNTGLSGNDLLTIKDKSLAIFKDANIAKLKEIQLVLKDFRKFINDLENGKDIVHEDIFENVLINNPDLLLSNNSIKEVVGFLKGDISLKKYGYQGADFRLNPKLYSFDFLKKLTLEDYETLFKADLETVTSNLYFIETLCSNNDINFRELKINEDMIMMLLRKDLSDIDYSFSYLKDIFTSDELKLLLEANPKIFTIKKRDLTLMVNRSINNENPDFTFDKLLATELYYYNEKDFDNVDEEVILNRPFKYVDLGFENKDINMEELLLGTHLSDGLDVDAIYALYTTRNDKYSKILKIINQLETTQYTFKEFFDISNNLLESYKELYTKVPNLALLEQIRGIISNRIENYQMSISDNQDLIDSKNELISIYNTENKDSQRTKTALMEIIKNISSDVIKDDINKFLKHLDNDRIKLSEKKIIEITNSKELLESSIKVLTREAEHLDFILRSSDPTGIIDSLDIEYRAKPSFTINSLNTKATIRHKSEEELIKEALNDKNVVVFANGIDLNDIPNDRHFIEKVNKFLGDGDSSITSFEFMNDIAGGNDTDYIERYGSYRARICARRENRTQIRVYYIPIHTKYFTCYFVTGVNYKDHSHSLAGMDDAVYASRIDDALSLEKTINSMSLEEAIEFIKVYREIYLKEMEPIFTKYNAYQTKKKNNNNKK